MKKIRILFLLIGLSVASCVKVSQETAKTAAPIFVTATLPPTKQSLSLPTDISLTFTPDASTPMTPSTPDPDGTAETTSEPATGPCQDSAILLEDVTVPDNSQMSRGQKFTKTWRFLNNGKCKWSGYTISFAAGDRM